MLDDLHNIKTEDFSGSRQNHSCLPGQLPGSCGHATRNRVGGDGQSRHSHGAGENHSQPQTVEEVCGSIQLNPEATARLKEDALRGGSAAHPLTLIFLSSFLRIISRTMTFRKLTSRSIKSFQAIWEKASGRSFRRRTRLFGASYAFGTAAKRWLSAAMLSAPSSISLEKRLLDEVGGTL